jgi:hypothetical protein
MKEVCRKLGEWLYNIALALIIYGIISPALRKRACFKLENDDYSRSGDYIFNRSWFVFNLLRR